MYIKCNIPLHPLVLYLPSARRNFVQNRMCRGKKYLIVCIVIWHRKSYMAKTLWGAYGFHIVAGKIPVKVWLKNLWFPDVAEGGVEQLLMGHKFLTPNLKNAERKKDAIWNSRLKNIFFPLTHFSFHPPFIYFSNFCYFFYCFLFCLPLIV